MTEPNPGTQEAIDAGCTCPVIDNRYGKGYYGAPDGVFIYTVGCKVHVAIHKEKGETIYTPPLVFCRQCKHKTWMEDLTEAMCKATKTRERNYMGEYSSYSSCESTNMNNKCEMYEPNWRMNLKTWLRRNK